MGTWGSGNFDSDSACEFLDDYIVDLVEKIRNIISLHEPDKSDELKSFITEYNA